LKDLKTVACKIHELNSKWDSSKRNNYIKHVLREKEIHTNLSHPRIVEMYDAFTLDDFTLVTVLEYCQDQDLDAHLKKNVRLAEKEAKVIVSQIFSGLKYLNELDQKIIHFDLKPANILMTNDGIKLTDFGLSKIMDKEDLTIDLTSQGAGNHNNLKKELIGTCHQNVLKQMQKFLPKLMFGQQEYYGINCYIQKNLLGMKYHKKISV
jgi:tousled-like kinase